MDELATRYKQLQQASKTLDESIRVFQQCAQLGAFRELAFDETVLLFMLRDSVIHRFEYCYELLWKYCKLLLWNVHGLAVQSPRAVFREMVLQQMLSSTESEELLCFVDTRNKTSHIYDAAMAETASREIYEHYKVLIAVTQKLDPQNYLAK